MRKNHPLSLIKFHRINLAKEIGSFNFYWFSFYGIIYQTRIIAFAFAPNRDANSGRLLLFLTA